MIKELTPIIGMLCLVILGIVIAVMYPNAITQLMVIVGLIGTIAGVSGTIAIPKIIRRFRK